MLNNCIYLFLKKLTDPKLLDSRVQFILFKNKQSSQTLIISSYVMYKKFISSLWEHQLLTCSNQQLPKTETDDIR